MAERSPCRWRTAALVISVLSVGGCGVENSIDPENQASVIADITRTVPGVSDVEVDPSGDGFTLSYELAVSMSSSADTDDAAREQARRTAEVVWDQADVEWDRLRVHVHCIDPERERRNRCPDVELLMTPAAATKLWGPPARGDHEADKYDAGFPGFDYENAQELPRGWDLRHVKRVDRGVVWELHIPPGVTPAKRDAAAKRIEAMLWRNQPYAIKELQIDVIEQTAGAEVDHKGIDERRRWHLRHTASELRETHGPRAPDLEP